LKSSYIFEKISLCIKDKEQVMQVNQISFQAQVPYRLRNRLLMTVHSGDKTRAKACLEQVDKIEKYGLDTSTIATVRRDDNTPVLALVNSYLAPLKHVEFKQKDNIYDTFMSLTKQDIESAEHTLKV
jgi:hypothetical protein